MRHTIPRVIAFAMLVAACSGTGPAATTAPAVSSSTRAPTTSSPPTSAAVATTSTEAAPAPTAFETTAGTPTGAFDSFTASMKLTMTRGDTTIEAGGTGTWTTDAFTCTVTASIGGVKLEQRLVGTPAQLWVDAGFGFQRSNAFAPEARGLLPSCPAAPTFWQTFGASGSAPVAGEPDTVGGRAAIRTDLTDARGTLDGLGLVPRLDGATVDELTMWVDRETNVVLELTATMEVSPEILQSAGEPVLGAGEGPVRVTIELQVDNVNDPDLTVEIPDV